MMATTAGHLFLVRCEGDDLVRDAGLDSNHMCKEQDRTETKQVSD